MILSLTVEGCDNNGRKRTAKTVCCCRFILVLFAFDPILWIADANKKHLAVACRCVGDSTADGTNKSNYGVDICFGNGSGTCANTKHRTCFGKSRRRKSGEYHQSNKRTHTDSYRKADGSQPDSACEYQYEKNPQPGLCLCAKHQSRKPRANQSGGTVRIRAKRLYALRTL